MFAIVICLVLSMCTLTIWSSMLCVLIVEGMSVVVNVMLSLMSVMSPPPALCNLSVRTDVKLCIFGVLALFNCAHLYTTWSPLDLWTEPTEVMALLASGTGRLAGGPQARRSDSPNSKGQESG